MAAEGKSRLAALALLAGALFTGAATAGGLAGVEERGVLKVAVYDDFGPYSCNGRQGGLTGVDVAVAEALAQRMGLQLELVGFSSADSMDSDIGILQEPGEPDAWSDRPHRGRAPDLMMHTPVDPAFADRNPDYAFFSPYFHESMAVLYDREALGRVPSLVDGPEPFEGVKVGVEMYTLSYTFLTNGFDGRLRDSNVSHKSVPLAVEAMVNGEVQAVMAPRGELQYGLAGFSDPEGSYGLSGLTDLFRTDRVRSEWDVGIGALAENRALIAAVERAMDDLIADGTIESLFADYGIEWIAPGTDAVQAAYRGDGSVNLPKRGLASDQLCERHVPAGLL